MQLQQNVPEQNDLTRMQIATSVSIGWNTVQILEILIGAVEVRDKNRSFPRNTPYMDKSEIKKSGLSAWSDHNNIAEGTGSEPSPDEQGCPRQAEEMGKRLKAKTCAHQYRSSRFSKVQNLAKAYWRTRNEIVLGRCRSGQREG